MLHYLFLSFVFKCLLQLQLQLQLQLRLQLQLQLQVTGYRFYSVPDQSAIYKKSVGLGPRYLYFPHHSEWVVEIN